MAFLLLWSFVLCAFHAHSFKAGGQMQIESTHRERHSQNNPAIQSGYSHGICIEDVGNAVFLSISQVCHFQMQASKFKRFADFLYVS